MRKLGLFDAKNRLSEVCEKVAQTGEPWTITRRGRPLVKIVPVERETQSVWDTVEEGHHRYGPIRDEIELPAREASRNRPSPL